MEIFPAQVASETRVDDAHPLITALKAAGANKPKIVLVYDEDDAGSNLKVRVFYHSSTELEKVELNKPTLLMETRMHPSSENGVIKTVYPEGYVQWCGVIAGQLRWIP